MAGRYWLAVPPRASAWAARNFKGLRGNCIKPCNRRHHSGSGLMIPKRPKKEKTENKFLQQE